MSSSSSFVVDIELARRSRTYRPGDSVTGIATVRSADDRPRDLPHKGITIELACCPELELASSRGLFEAFSMVAPAICAVETLAKPAGTVRTPLEIPFEMPLEPLQGHKLLETYHGRMVRIEYRVRLGVQRGVLKRNLECIKELYVHVPSARPAWARELGADSGHHDVLKQLSLEKRGKADAASAVLVSSVDKAAAAAAAAEAAERTGSGSGSGREPVVVRVDGNRHTTVQLPSGKFDVKNGPVDSDTVVLAELPGGVRWRCDEPVEGVVRVKGTFQTVDVAVRVAEYNGSEDTSRRETVTVFAVEVARGPLVLAQEPDSPPVELPLHLLLPRFRTCVSQAAPQNQPPFGIEWMFEVRVTLLDGTRLAGSIPIELVRV